MATHRGLLHHMIINVSNVARSSPFYSGMFRYFGYTLADSSYGEDYGYEDWRRLDLETPHEISICQVRAAHQSVPHRRGALGHHDHIAFCAASREDIDRFYAEILDPLEKEGLCRVENPPCNCPEYGEGYYATFSLILMGLNMNLCTSPEQNEISRIQTIGS